MFSEGTCSPYIYRDIGGQDRYIWYILGHLLAFAAISPFVGAISDLVGRRWTALSGTAIVVVGMIVGSTANTMNTFIGEFSFTLLFGYYQIFSW